MTKWNKKAIDSPFKASYKDLFDAMKKVEIEGSDKPGHKATTRPLNSYVAVRPRESSPLCICRLTYGSWDKLLLSWDVHSQLWLASSALSCSSGSLLSLLPTITTLCSLLVRTRTFTSSSSTWS